MHAIQENIEILGDGYRGDIVGESTPDVLVSEFVRVCYLAFPWFEFRANLYNKPLYCHFDSDIKECDIFT